MEGLFQRTGRAGVLEVAAPEVQLGLVAGQRRSVMGSGARAFKFRGARERTGTGGGADGEEAAVA